MAESSSHHKKDAFNYDVFLSFYGNDTRHGFTGNLYSALGNRGIRTFFDKEDLQSVIGIPIREALEKAINESRIVIPVMSINYAFSSFCLEELETTMKKKASSILPIFYKIEPSILKVNKSSGPYKDGLAKHMKNPKFSQETISNWTKTLDRVAEFPGHHFKDGQHYEYEFIGNIVNIVSKKIDRPLVRVAKHPVGLDSRIQQVMKLLEDVPSCEGARMIGITGQGGLGKTTLALAIYNFIADRFDASCFLRDVKDKAKRNDGLLDLQKDLLSKLLGQKEFNFTSPEEGIVQLEHKLRLKNVLIILDDVDELKQLEFTAGERNWFHTGSTIIITTRDKQLLKNHKIKAIYEMEELNNENALRLLKLNALKAEEMNGSRFLDVFNRVAAYCSGLPLALELIGSTLYGKPINIWESAVSQLAERRTLNSLIFDALKLSYDNLQYDLERRVFLDIACCFKGYSLEDLKIILHARYGYSMEYTLDVLIHRCLIKIIQNDRYGNVVTLHDLVEDMGKELVIQKSPKESGRRSRLWSHKDIVHILTHNTGSENTEIINLKFPTSSIKEGTAKVEWNGDAFQKMKNLQILIIKNGDFFKGPIHLPNSLKVLEWPGYPLEEFPPEFCPENLVMCSLPNGLFASNKLTSISRKTKYTCMRMLHLDGCPNLKCIPDVSSFSNLEDLSFSWCKNLNKIHESVGFLKNLKTLNAIGCGNLKSFPPLKLPALENLQISYCSKLKLFPEILGEMGKITQLEIKKTPIVTLSSSFGKLTGLRRLTMETDEFRQSWDGAAIFNSTVITMPHLTEISATGMNGWELPQAGSSSSSNITSISLKYCNLMDEFLEALSTWFPYLEKLSLSSEDFIETIPKCFEEIRSLKELHLKYCSNLKCIEGIPSNLECLDIHGVPEVTLSNTNKFLMNQELYEDGNKMFNFVAYEIPSWFEHRFEGTSTCFWFRNKLPQLVICLTPSSSNSRRIRSCGLELDINGIKYVLWDCVLIGNIYILGMNKVRLEGDLEGAILENEWNHVQVICSNSKGETLVVQSGIHVLEHKSDKQDIRFTDPFERLVDAKVSSVIQTVQQQQGRKRKRGGYLSSKGAKA